MQKHFNAKLLAHIVMITFAVASYGNVEAFLFDVHHNELVSNGLGVALGAGLVTMALLLSGMPMRGRDFHLVLVVTTALALMSGGIQAASYARDMEMYWACLMGFSLPVVGELGLALAVSAYQSAKRHERVHNAQDTLAEGIRAEIADAVSAIEPQKIRNSVNRAAERIAEAVVQHTVSDLLAELRTSEAHPKSEAETSRVVAVAEVATEAIPEAVGEGVQGRLSAILEIFRIHPQAKTAEVAAKLAEDFAISVSDRTVLDDLKSLADDGHVVNVGRGKWESSVVCTNGANVH